MAKLLFNLRNVPDDEAADVRALLETHRVDFYETPMGLFGISAGGYWLRDKDAYPAARALIDRYQEERRQRVRAEQAEAERDGSAPTFARLLREQPGFVLSRLLGIVVILGLVLLLPLVLLR